MFMMIVIDGEGEMGIKRFLGEEFVLWEGGEVIVIEFLGNLIF